MLPPDYPRLRGVLNASLWCGLSSLHIWECRLESPHHKSRVCLHFLVKSATLRVAPARSSGYCRATGTTDDQDDDEDARRQVKEQSFASGESVPTVLVPRVEFCGSLV